MGIALYELLWAVLASSGVSGSPSIAAVLAIVSGTATGVFTASVFIAKWLRWPVLEWIIEGCVPTILAYHPGVIIGVGRGGAHIAAMLCHKLSTASHDYEPAFVGLDRRYSLDDNRIITSVGDLCSLQLERIRQNGPVLVVIAEVHVGDTLDAVRRLLDRGKIEYRTFTVIKSAAPRVRPDYFALETENRFLLPWGFSARKQQLIDHQPAGADGAR